MSTVVGQVQAVAQRGNATNIQVNGQWFGCGFNGVPCKKGDQVQFDVVQNGQYANCKVETMQILGAAQPQAQQQQASYGNSGAKKSYAPRQGASPAASKDDYWTKKEERDVVTQTVIQLQASRNAAIAVCSSALSAGILPLPAKKADAFDAFLAAVDEVTQRYEVSSAAKREGGDPFADNSGAVEAGDDWS